MDLTTWGVWSDLPVGWPGVDRTVGRDEGGVGTGKIVGVDADRAISHGPPDRFGDPFVGRVAALASALETVGGGFGGVVPVVLVSGEAGVGKSRFAHEVTARMPQRTVWSSCWEGDGAPPFWPWLQVLRALRARGRGSGPLVRRSRIARRAAGRAVSRRRSGGQVPAVRCVRRCRSPRQPRPAHCWS